MRYVTHIHYFASILGSTNRRRASAASISAQMMKAIGRAVLADLRKAAASTVLGKDSAGVAKTSAEGELLFYRPAPHGCEACSHKGYRGRIGIYELMMLDEEVRKVILDPAADSKAIQRAARRNGMRVLREDGARQVIAGITSIEEVLAATQAGEM